MTKIKNYYIFILLAAGNTIISTLVSLPLTGYWDAPFYLEAIAFISHFFMLNLASGLILFILYVLSPVTLSLIFNILIYSAMQVLLLIDIKIYSIFRYHINSLVWNVITVEGVSDSLTLGKGTILHLAFISAIIIFIEIFMNVFLAKKEYGLLKSISKYVAICGLLLILIDKGIYAYSDLVNWREITDNAKLYPLYQPLTIKRFATKYLGINVNREEKLEFAIKQTNLNYPKRALKFNNSRNFNILIIAVEGLRFDMLDEEVMPEVSKFSRESLVFRNHYSAGNASRFGIFGLLYAISGTYWHTFLASRVSPVLIDTLIERGYEFMVLSSTRLTFPEFRKTAFVRIPDAITDSFDTELREERDRIITEKFINFLKNRTNERPFFSFMFFDSSHQPFHYPEGFEKFKPALSKEINYFKDISRDKAYLIRNKYKNSIFYEDYLIGKILKELRERKLLENTIVAITGDHGEEFYENGYLGHTSAFDDYQTRVVFVLYHPDTIHKEINEITSHLDLVPTIMESLGCTSPAEDYSQGMSLLNVRTRPFIITSNWDTSAFIDSEYRIIFSTESYKIGKFEIRTRDGYEEVKNTSVVLKSKMEILRNGLYRLSEFYR